jgi:hypothetical protein
MKGFTTVVCNILRRYMGIKKGLVTYIVTKFSNKAKKWDIGL